MVSVIEGGANQIGHAGIDDSETFGLSLLDIQHSGDETAALGDNGASQLEVEFLVGAQMQMIAEHLEIAFEIGTAEASLI